MGRSRQMKIDIHVHVADIDALLSAEKTGAVPPYNGHLTRMLRRAVAERAESDRSGTVNDWWIQRLLSWVRESPLDKVVLLALDGVYDDSGRACPGKTVLQVDNDFVGLLAGQYPEFIFGASVHPYRKDAVDVLAGLVKKGAGLIKWIPSGQHIEPDDPKCIPFYEAMAHYGIPLLTHTGKEHTLGSRRSTYNHPQRLIPALEHGVTVIAAHCGVHLFLHEPSFFGSWASLARKYENLYGDSAAFSVMTRIPALKRILGDRNLRSKLVYGSDFPGIPSPIWCWQLGLAKMRELSKMTNPLARNMRVMQVLDTSAEVFERAHGLGIAKEAA